MYLSVRVVNGIILTAVMLAFISTAKRKATLYNLARRWHKRISVPSQPLSPQSGAISRSIQSQSILLVLQQLMPHVDDLVAPRSQPIRPHKRAPAPRALSSN